MWNTNHVTTVRGSNCIWKVFQTWLQAIVRKGPKRPQCILSRHLLRLQTNSHWLIEHYFCFMRSRNHENYRGKLLFCTLISTTDWGNAGNFVQPPFFTEVGPVGLSGWWAILSLPVILAKIQWDEKGTPSLPFLYPTIHRSHGSRKYKKLIYFSGWNSSAGSFWFIL